MDGLPGIKHVANKVPKNVVSQALEKSGLSLEAINRGQAKPTWLMPLVAGITIGVLITTLPQHGLDLLRRNPVSNLW